MKPRPYGPDDPDWTPSLGEAQASVDTLLEKCVCPVCWLPLSRWLLDQSGWPCGRNVRNPKKNCGRRLSEENRQRFDEFRDAARRFREWIDVIKETYQQWAELEQRRTTWDQEESLLYEEDAQQATDEHQARLRTAFREAEELISAHFSERAIHEDLRQRCLSQR